MCSGSSAVTRSRCVRFGQALQLKPNYVEALVERGKVLVGLKRHEQALASYDRALATKPNDAEALHSRGAALHHLKRNDEALASFEQALAADPHHPQAFGGALPATITFTGPGKRSSPWSWTLALLADNR
jgi:tetratricopeptide (TPR) repeat protein